MDDINQESLNKLLNKRIKIESQDKTYTGVLMSVDAHQIKLKIASQVRRVVTISISDIDAVVYKIGHKKVGY